MRRTLFILLGVPVLLAAGLWPASGMTATGLKTSLAGGKITVIDIRSPSAYGEEHIPGAINIPAALCPRKILPPIGKVVVYGDGIGGDDAGAAAAALSKKPGLTVEILEGGYAAWKSSQGMTTRGAGLKKEAFNYISYAHLKAAAAGNVVLLDVRKPSAAHAMTDLKTEFPALRQARSLDEVKGMAAGSNPPLIALIDNGDGTAEKQARLLKAGGNHNYVILAGGELILSRKGQAGLQRKAPVARGAAQTPSAPGGKN
jgi:rhodanese-related sulfurtransferase